MRYMRCGPCYWNLDQGWDLVRDRPAETAEVPQVKVTERTTWPLGVSRDALETADVTAPLLVATVACQDDELHFILDGQDQWWAASVRGIRTLTAYVLSARESLEIMVAGRDFLEHAAARFSARGP